MDQKTVVEYYDYTIPFYKLFWHKGTNALHYGLWDTNTKTLQEALVNTNKVVSELARIQKSDTVLDAGCGVGGTSIWIAKNIGAQVVGVTLSEKQKLKAEKYARKEGVRETTQFSVQDFTHTTFPDASFDAVIAIESVCHAKDKSEFIKEAHRLLKPGGKLVVADGFLAREPIGEEVAIYNDFLTGLALENLAKSSDFERSMNEVGFKNVLMRDKTEAIQKASDYMCRLTSNWMWLTKTLRILRLVPQLMVDNMQAGIVQRDFVKGPGMYAIFYGEK